MILLAIDTSSEMASLALSNEQKLIVETTWFSGQNHTVQLLPHITAVLEKTGIDTGTIGGIVVARGPGSFNGIRVGISTAKSISFSLGIPVKGIGTLETTAYQHAESELPVCAIQNAGRGEIAAAFYQKYGKIWRQLTAEHITTLDALLGGIAATTIFCGECVPVLAGEIVTRLGKHAVIPPYASHPRRAFFLCELGLEQIKRGNQDDPATLQPIYLRRPPITERKHH